MAEQLILEDISTGASNDLQQATTIARQMLTKYGFSERLGPVGYGTSQEAFSYTHLLYQGIPNGGYTAMVEKMLDGTEVRLNVDYLAGRENLNALAEKVVYTGPVDAYFGYRLGALQYRSVRFETEVLDTDNYQGNAVVNYTCLLYTSRCV